MIRWEYNMKQKREDLLLRLIAHNAHPQQLPNFFIQPKPNQDKPVNHVPESLNWLKRLPRKSRERSDLLSRRNRNRNQFSTLGEQRQAISKPLTTSFQFHQPPENLDERQHTHHIDLDTDGVLSVLEDVNIDLQERQNRSTNTNYIRERKYRQAKTTTSTRPLEQIKLCEKRLDLPMHKLEEARYTPKNQKQSANLHHFSRKSNLRVNPEWLVTQKVTLIEQSHPQSRKQLRNLTGKSRIRTKQRKQYSEIPIRPWEHWEQNQNTIQDFQML